MSEKPKFSYSANGDKANSKPDSFAQPTRQKAQNPAPKRAGVHRQDINDIARQTGIDKTLAAKNAAGAASDSDKRTAPHDKANPNATRGSSARLAGQDDVPGSRKPTKQPQNRKSESSQRPMQSDADIQRDLMRKMESQKAASGGSSEWRGQSVDHSSGRVADAAAKRNFSSLAPSADEDDFAGEVDRVMKKNKTSRDSEFSQDDFASRKGSSGK
ncbi:MAG: hypothetical protein RRY38_03375, partial [Oscillospiraceae bacterium]